MLIAFKIVFVLILPWFWMELKRREIKIVATLGVVILCYLSGMILGAIKWLNPKQVEWIAQASFPLALPLLLFQSKIKQAFKTSSSFLGSFILAILAVGFSLAILSLFFGKIPLFSSVAGMMGGMLTGGHVNFSAVGVMIGVKPELFLELSTYDVLIGGVYYFFLLKFFTVFTGTVHQDPDKKDKFVKNRFSWRRGALSFFLALLIVLLSSLITWLLFKSLAPAPLIFLLTSFSLALSSHQKVQTLEESYSIGEYFLFIFCITIGMLLDFEKMKDIPLDLFGLVLGIYLLTALFYFVFIRAFKIKATNGFIVHIAAIYGPPFIAPVTERMRKSQLLAPGLLIALLGQALGTYIGLGLYYIFEWMKS